MKNEKKAGKVDLSKFTKLDKNQLNATIGGGGAVNNAPVAPADPIVKPRDIGSGMATG